MSYENSKVIRKCGVCFESEKRVSAFSLCSFSFFFFYLEGLRKEVIGMYLMLRSDMIAL